MPVLVASTQVAEIVEYDQRVVEINGIRIASGGGAVDASGLRWVLEDVTGWDSPPSPTGDVTALAGRNGGSLTPSFWGPRTIAVTGSVGADLTTGLAAIRSLMASLPLDQLTTVTISGGGPAMQTEVRLGGEPLVTATQGATRFSLSLVAPDQLRYGVDLHTVDTGLPATSGGLSLPLVLPLSVGGVVTSGRVSVTNDGDISTPPVMRVYGPCPPWSITHVGSSRRIWSTLGVADGRFVEIDFADNTALLDGLTPTSAAGLWFELEPGVNEVAFSASSYDPAARLEVSYRSAWR